MVKTITDIDFKTELDSNENVAIKFYADWCGTCRLISPKFKKMSEQDNYANISFIEVNAETNPEARKWASVTNLPFFAVVKNGEIVEASSAGKEEKILELLEKLV
jgi:thiol-disulfide isomerase/thioredoxin